MTTESSVRYYQVKSSSQSNHPFCSFIITYVLTHTDDGHARGFKVSNTSALSSSSAPSQYNAGNGSSTGVGNGSGTFNNGGGERGGGGGLSGGGLDFGSGSFNNGHSGTGGGSDGTEGQGSRWITQII